MTGLLILTIIGVKFFDLAKENSKNKWLFAVLGLGSYFLGNLIVSLIFTIGKSGGAQTESFAVWMFAVLIGLLSSYVFYKMLKFNWTKQVV